MKFVRTAAALSLASAATIAVMLFPAGPAQADITWGVGAEPETSAKADITWGLTDASRSSIQAKDITWG